MDVNTLIEENMGRLTLAARKLSIYRNATPFTMPPDRFRVLRRVAKLLADRESIQEI